METDRIILRKWTLEDVDILVKNLNNEQMSNELGTDYPYSHENAYRYIDDAIKYSKEKYAIVLKKNMIVVGGCGIHFASSSVSCNIWIAPSYQGIGLGTETLFLLAKHCFYDLNIEKLENVFFAENNASKQMQEKLGAVVCEGNEEIVVNGKKRLKRKSIISRENFEKLILLLQRK